MAKKTPEPETDSTPEAPQSGNGESVAGYFRPIFAENPELLNERSNEALYQRWLQDHPGETVVPDKVKQSLSNIKSILRHKLEAKRGPGRPKKEEQPIPAASPRPAKAKLEQLEQSIDDSLALAKQIDREGLHDIIRLLRSARNRVVIWMDGE